jgi:hypothetical protein
MRLLTNLSKFIKGPDIICPTLLEHMRNPGNRIIAEFPGLLNRAEDGTFTANPVSISISTDLPPFCPYLFTLQFLPHSSKQI